MTAGAGIPRHDLYVGKGGEVRMGVAWCSRSPSTSNATIEDEQNRVVRHEIASKLSGVERKKRKTGKKR